MIRMVYVGLSGVGKDYLLSKVEPEISSRKIEVVSFGQRVFEEISRADPSIKTRDELSGLSHGVRQRYVDTCVAKILAIRRLLLNTHVVIVGDDNVDADTTAIERMAPDFITCVVADPDVIWERAVSDYSRNRIHLTSNQISGAQNLEKDVIQSLAGKTGARLTFLDNSENDSSRAVDNFRDIIASTF